MWKLRDFTKLSKSINATKVSRKQLLSDDNYN